MSFSSGQCFPLIFDEIKGYSFAIFAGGAALALIATYLKIYSVIPGESHIRVKQIEINAVK